MRLLLSGRTNAPESRVRPPLAHLPHANYLAWWDQLPADASQPIAGRWGHPADIGSITVPLATGQMAFANGAVIPVDGGLSIPRL